MGYRGSFKDNRNKVSCLYGHSILALPAFRCKDKNYRQNNKRNGLVRTCFHRLNAIIFDKGLCDQQKSQSSCVWKSHATLPLLALSVI